MDDMYATRDKLVLRGRRASCLCKVELEYRNKDMDIVAQKECGLDEYSEVVKTGLLKLILEAEDLAYKATDGQSKSEWDDSIAAVFYRLRHKILDIAGEIGRLPQNLVMEIPVGYSHSPTVAPVNAQTVQGFFPVDNEAEKDVGDIHPAQLSAFRWID